VFSASLPAGRFSFLRLAYLSGKDKEVNWEGETAPQPQEADFEGHRSAKTIHLQQSFNFNTFTTSTI
jgi:hypothetical protein